MIYLIEGVPGSGKTFYAMQKYLIPNLKKGKRIFTNISGLKLTNICVLFDIDESKIEDVHICKTTDTEQIRGLFNMNTLPNALIIVDELQKYFNSRDFKESHCRNVIDYLTEHRHYGHTIVGITQNIDSVDITFRRNATQVVRLTNMGYVGLQSKAKCHFYESSDTTKSPIATSVISYDNRVFKCYESVEPEANVEHTKFIFPKKLILVAFAVIFFILASKKLGGVAKAPLNQKEIKKTEQVNQFEPVSPDSSGLFFNNEGKVCFGNVCR